MRAGRVTVILLALTAAAFSCTKTPDVECLYTITPYAIDAEGETTAATTDIVAYSFKADTAVWESPTYADALAGTIAMRTGGAQKAGYDVKAYPDDNGDFEFTFTSKPQMIVVCSAKHNVYASRGANLHEGIERMRVSVTFDSRLSDTVFYYSGWKYVYGDK